MAFNPNEPRDEFGRWTSFGGALSGGDGRRRPRPLRPQDRRVRRETRPFRGFGIKGEVRYLGEHGFWEIRRGGGRGWRTQNPYGLPTLKGFGGRHAIGTDGDLAIFPDLDAAESGWIDDLAYNGNRLTVGQFLKNHFAKLGIDGEQQMAELSDTLKAQLKNPILGMGGEARTHLVKFLEDLHPMAEGFIEHGPVTHDTPLPDLHAADGQSQHGRAGPQGARESSPTRDKVADSNSKPLPTGVDWNFIAHVEGSRSDGYVPLDKNGNPASRSGVTIAVGFDLGERTVANLQQLGLSRNIVSTLTPYLGIRGNSANEYLKLHPLKITISQVEEINANEFRAHYHNVSNNYNADNGIGAKFENLPQGIQTAIVSLARLIHTVPESGLADVA